MKSEMLLTHKGVGCVEHEVAVCKYMDIISIKNKDCNTEFIVLRPHD